MEYGDHFHEGKKKEKILKLFTFQEKTVALRFNGEERKTAGAHCTKRQFHRITTQTDPRCSCFSCEHGPERP